MMRSLYITLMLIMLVAGVSHAAGPYGCPPGFTDTGAHCLKPPIYSRGAGNRSNAHCEADYGIGNCEKCLSLYYPRCDENYETQGCNVCSPKCPPNMTDIGVSCQK